MFLFEICTIYVQSNDLLSIHFIIIDQNYYEEQTDYGVFGEYIYICFMFLIYNINSGYNDYLSNRFVILDQDYYKEQTEYCDFGE